MLPGTLHPKSYLTKSARRELEFTKPIAKGAGKAEAKRVQEHLCLNGHAVPIDGNFGPATEQQVKAFQSARGLPASGIVDMATFEKLVDPMVRALQPVSTAGKSLSQLVVDYARQHVKQHPLGVGGPNAGPWVRMYLGWEGVEAKWCAGFVCYALEQAADALGKKPPIASSASCDVLAERAKMAGLFVPEKAVATGTAPRPRDGSFFLVRRTPTDWIHVGILFDAGSKTFGTLEGNTNSNGSSNGIEAIEQVRNYSSKDFIVWP